MTSRPEPETGTAQQQSGEPMLLDNASESPLPPFDVKETLALVLHRAVEWLGPSLALIALRTDQPPPLRLHALHQGVPSPSPTELDSFIENASANSAFRTQDIVYLTPICLPPELKGFRALRELVYAPIVVAGKSVGLLCLGNLHPTDTWGAATLYMAQRLAHQARLTLELAQTYNHLRQRLGGRRQDADCLRSLSDLWQDIQQTHNQLMADAWQQLSQLDAVEHTLLSLIKSAYDPVVVIQDEQFRYVNQRMTEVLGYSAEECYQMDEMLELVVERHRAMVAGHHRRLLRGEPVTAYEFVATDKSGSEIVLEATSAVIEFGRRPALLEVWHNITQQRQLRAQVLLSGKLAALGQLISGVAHELNNPLTTVLGFSELVLTNTHLSEDLRRDLKTIASEARRARKIVQNLLAFAYQPDAERRLVNLNQAITETLELRAYELRMNNIEVITTLDPELPAVIADVDQMKQVFLNIIINAEQVLMEREGRGRLEIKTGSKICHIAGVPTEWVEIRFCDDGPGIPPENLSRIFDSFFTTKELGKGTGLGLAISSSIIKDHGGRIYAQNASGRGAEFIIELPAQTRRRV